MNDKKEKTEIVSYNELKKQIEQIIAGKESETYVNTREYELHVTKLASNTKFNDKLISEVEDALKKSDGGFFGFTLFYILFTWKRRNNYKSLKEFYDDYRLIFKDYKILTHIKGMTVLAENNQPEDLKKTIDEIDDFINRNSEFSTHVGVLNLYVELVCNYCELKFDERSTDEITKLLNKALERINEVIKEEEKTSEKAYQKFYLNKGRILVMLKDYDNGEEEIKKAISLIPISQDRAIIVNNYSQYIAKSSMLRAFDLNDKKLKEFENYKNEKIKEINRYKIDSYKIITLIMAVIGFLLGAINIFTSVTDTFTLLMLMAAYCGLMLFLVGIVLLCFHFYLKEYKAGKKEKSSKIIPIVLISLGFVVFAVPLIITILNVAGVFCI